MQRRHLNGERGTSLVIALVFISVFGLIMTGLLNFSDASVRASSGFQDQRETNYATDAALEAAINRVGGDPNIGIDPSLSPSDACNPVNGETIIRQPASGKAPDIVVSCQVSAGSGSGKPAELGSASEFALLTLGDRRTDTADGLPNQALLGVRNTQPPAYNGNVATFAWFSGSGDPCPGDRQESGIRLNRTVYPWVLQIFGIPIASDCADYPNAFAWNVRGNVFSNSKITVDTPSAVPTMLADPDSNSGTIKARGGCVGSGFGAVGTNTYCQNAGWDFADGQGRDPGLEHPAEYAPRSLSGLTVQTVPPASQCTNARNLVTFSPGIYTSAKALNDLFGNASCKSASFWFTPGTYYFDFRNTDASYQCGTDQSTGLYDSNVTQNTVHQWCVGGAANDFGGQRVVAGTPFGWSPDADPTNKVITLEPAGQAGAGPGWFFGLFPQPTLFTNGANAKAIDGSTADFAMTSGRSGSSIWLSNYPDVPRGSYNLGIDLEIAHAAVNPTRMNAPTVQVDYQTTGWAGIKVTGTCGPYTLPKAPASGSIDTIKLSVVNPTAAANLSTCLNTGDRINSAVVRYNANRPSFQGSPYATAKLDGVRILVTSQDRPEFPTQPSAEDPGGDCDPQAPGVQLIFGGDSRVYVPNGGFEICAGPNPADPLHGQQMAIYGVPATPRLVASSVSGSTNPANAKLIGEGSGLVYAQMAASGNVTSAFPGYTVPSGYSVSKVEMRASYEAAGSAPTVAVQSSGGATYCNPSFASTSTSGIQGRTVDVSSCLNTGSRLTSAFRVSWTGGSCSGGNCPKLDGVEFIVTLTPNNPDTTLRPGNGCITASPNLWYGTGDPECSVVRVDGPVDTSGNFLGGIFGNGIEKRGRLSIKGSVYAPSASVDIDDEQVWYPIASRGMVARHLRLRGFKYYPGYTDPAFNNWVDTTPAGRQVVLLACAQGSGACTPDDPDLIGRAAVGFAADSSEPSIAGWSVGTI